MEALLICVSLLIFRIFSVILEKYLKRGANWIYGFIVVANVIYGGTLLFLVKQNLLHTSLGIWAVGFSIFYLVYVFGE